MKQTIRIAGAAVIALVAQLAPIRARAQDSLRVLRLQPASPASPVEPLVVTFDHPVAPRLDLSVDPTRVLRIVPAVGVHASWRDPSTIVAEFDSAWTSGASYDVRIDPTLRSVNGLALASRGPFTVHVRMPATLGVFGSSNDSETDTVAHPVAVFDAPFDLAALAGHAWLVPSSTCPIADSLPLQPVRLRRVSTTNDSYPVRYAGGYGRDRRLDSLRRVVEFDVPRTLPRGCRGEFRLPDTLGSSSVGRTPFAVRPPFQLVTVACSARTCPRRPITLRFTNATTADEVRAHVRVNGRPARVAGDETSASSFTLVDSIYSRRESRITVEASLRNARGERLPRDTTVVIVGEPTPPSVGYAGARLLVPRDAPAFLRVRHANTDSVTVVIGRAPVGIRSSLLSHEDNARGSFRWEHVVRDTIVRTMASVAPRDTERVVDIPTSWIPSAWRNDPMLIVRVMPQDGEKSDQSTDTSRAPRKPQLLPAIVVEAIGGATTPRFAVVQRSNIALHALGTAGNAEVWVTSLRNGTPRAGAVLRVLDDSMHSFGRAVTDARGRATLRYSLPPYYHQPLHIEAAEGDDRALLMLSPSPTGNAPVDEDSADVTWWYGRTARIGEGWLHGTAFAERGIYRPGERVYLGGAVRIFTADSGYRTPAGDSARWSLWYVNPESGRERVWSHTGRLSEFGTLADSVTLERTTRLGGYTATLALRAGGKWMNASRADFRVEEYRAPEFAVRLDADSSTPLFAGDTARVRINARYLFGLPMDGGAVHWWWGERERASWDQRVPGLERYTVGRSSWRLSDERRAVDLPSAEGDAVLAADGTFTLQMATRPLSRPGAVHLNVTVSDANRQAVTSQVDMPLHAADAYVGMRTRERRWIWRARDTIAVEILDVRHDGTPRTGDAISVVAQRTRWVESRLVRDTVWRTTLTSAATPVTALFAPGASGGYELIASVADEAGRGAVTGIDVWVTGATETWAARNPREITLRSDKTRYAADDTVSLAVESPAEQRAWVTLRREGLLHEQLIDLHTGINEVRVPLSYAAAPHAEIRVLAVRPYGARGSDSAGIYFRSGSLWVEVDSSARVLKVAIAPERTRYRPGDTVRVDVRVSDSAGKAKRAEATVWAVDEGVVALTDFIRPAMLSALIAGTWDYAWQSSTLLAWMMSVPPAVGPEYFQIGGMWYSVGSSAAASPAIRIRGASSLQMNVVTAENAGTNAPVRRLFATTPFFAGNVRTDANGHASVAFPLPDNVSTFRLYAAAVGDDVYAGSGDTSIISTLPLIVRSALPRIVRAGDTLFAGAVITQDALLRTPVSLSIATTNATVNGPATLHDTLDARRAREMRFPIAVTGGDSVTFTFRGTTSGSASASDAVEAKLAVSPPGRARAHVVSGMIDRAEEVSLAIPEGTDTVRSHVALQFGVSPLPLVRQFSEALRIYPYYCTEQVSSAGRALIARLHLQRALGDSATLTARDRAQLETGVAVLLGRQRDDGGFGYWSSSNWTTPWLSAYAVDFLVGARDVGIPVPAGALVRAKTFLASRFPLRLRTGDDPWVAWRDSVAWPHDAMASASMLRRIGSPDTTLERDLWKMRSKLGFEDRLSLATVLATRTDSARARELVTEAWRSARLEGRRVVLDDSTASRTWLFRSTVRPIALLLATSARLMPNHPLLGALFESVVQNGRSAQSRWWNTLDQAAVAEALAAAANTMELATTRRIAVSGPHGAIADVVLEPARADSLQLAVATLSVRDRNESALRLNLASTSRTPTYFAMTLFEVPLARPVRADDGGIGLERWYEGYKDGKPLTEVREGELVRVRLRITVPADREFVVIDDALPAGLEAVDLSLRTSASLPPFAGAPRLRGDTEEGPIGQRWLYGAWDSGWWTPWEHKEIRDDRVLYFARQLWKGSYQATYIARATTVGTFVRPPAQAEEMYNPAVHGRSDGGWFTVTRAPR